MLRTVSHILAIFAAFGAFASAAHAQRPNIVMVMTDDQSMNTVGHMPQVRRMAREGVSFSRYFVTDSLCCPSRASILTGKFPHDTGVLNNTPPIGGFSAFFGHGNETQTYATALQKVGYRTSYMGKYFNGYEPGSGHVPPGWSNFIGVGSGYNGFDYNMSVNGRFVHRGHRPRDYMTDVLSRQGLSFIDRMSHSRQSPFLLAIAPFAPHYPYVPAPRDRTRFPGLKAPRTKAWDAPTKHPPAWLGHRTKLSRAQVDEADLVYRKRVRSVQAVDLMLGRLRKRLARYGMEKNTYVIFTSDNGLHAGEHRLAAGKMTAFDTDIRVPLVAVGPGVPAGRTMGQMTANIDLAPTFMRLGGAAVPRTVDGHGFVSLLHGESPHRWRDAVLVEHHGPTTSVGDPDRQGGMSGNPPTYDAIRTRYSTWVEYANGDREYYDLRSDPDQLDNLAGDIDPVTKASLHGTLVRLRGCHHTGSCWRAAMR